MPGWYRAYPALVEGIVGAATRSATGVCAREPFFLKGPRKRRPCSSKRSTSSRRLGVHPLGSRTPSADPSKHTFGLLKKHGLVYHTNMMDSDLPYRHATPHGDLIELPTSWVNDDFMYSASARSAGGQQDLEPAGRVGDLGRGVRGPVRGGRLLQPDVPSPSHGPSVADAHARALIQHMLGKKDVRFAKPIDLARHYIAQSG